MKKHFFSKNVSRPSNPPDELAQNVSQKIPFGRVIPSFFSKVQNLTVFSIFYMIRIRFFGPGESVQRTFSGLHSNGQRHPRKNWAKGSESALVKQTKQIEAVSLGEWRCPSSDRLIFLTGDSLARLGKVVAAAPVISWLALISCQVWMRGSLYSLVGVFSFRFLDPRSL